MPTVSAVSDADPLRQRDAVELRNAVPESRMVSQFVVNGRCRGELIATQPEPTFSR